MTGIQFGNPSRVEDGRVSVGYSVSQDVRGVFEWLLVDFQPVKAAYLSCLDPGGYIKPHQDRGPHYERWQIPIRPAGWFRVGDDLIQQEAGVPFRVEHWQWHEVVNDTDRQRIHLIVDRNIIVQPDQTPLEWEKKT